jgi:transposase-like protein
MENSMAKRTKRSKEFKFKIALEAIKGDKQIAEIAQEYNIHPQQITQWKKELLDNGADIFAGKKDSRTKSIENERDEYYRTIGQQQIRIDFLKKKLGITHTPFDDE